MVDISSPQPRKIIHIDMDAFYASVEQRDFPEYRGKPLIVGGSPQSRAVVCTASYEARKFGVRSAMPCSQAARLCPQGIFISPRFDRYSEISQQIHQIFGDYSNKIESLGLDEAYLDVTENLRSLPSATDTARQIQGRIFETTGLTASAGVASNKMLAKIASDLKKPNGLTVIRPEQAQALLDTLPLRKLPGVGPVTEKRLQELGCKTVGDLKATGEVKLTQSLGKMGTWFYSLSIGQDDREVENERERKSVGSEDTFSIDVIDLQDLDAVLSNLSRRVSERLVEEDLQGRTITLKLKYHDFTQKTRSQTLLQPTQDSELILHTGRHLMQGTEAGRRPIRLLGVSISHLSSVHQTPIQRDSIQLEFDFTVRAD